MCPTDRAVLAGSGTERERDTFYCDWDFQIKYLMKDIPLNTKSTERHFCRLCLVCAFCAHVWTQNAFQPSSFSFFYFFFSAVKCDFSVFFFFWVEKESKTFQIMHYAFSYYVQFGSTFAFTFDVNMSHSRSKKEPPNF